MIDLNRARAETPGVNHVTHFNNAGAALIPQPVLDAVTGHLHLEARIGGYEAEARAADAVGRTYDAVAALLNCRREEIAIVENATVGWDMAFYGLAQTFAAGDRILTSMAEYSSNYIPFLQVARRTGAVVEAVPNDSHGQLDVDALGGMIDGRVKLIAITHIPTNGGLVNPAAAVGRIARRHGIPYLLDACQTAGQMPIDVDQLGCDMLSATGRKFLRAPRGTGFLYVRKTLLERLEPPVLDNHAATWVAPDRYEIHADGRRFENWESNVAAKIGLGVAVDYALGWGLDAIWDRVRNLGDLLRSRIAALPGYTVRDLGEVRCGIVTFTGPRPPAEIKALLAEQGINVSVTKAASTLLDMNARGLTEMVRASVHYYNTEDEIDRLASALS
jgi:selenocysteine lyase/cysteine desulfurase